MRDHSGLVVDDFRGDFDRGEDESTPHGYFLASRNVSFLKGGAKTRGGTDLFLTLPAIRRTAIYSRIGEAKRLLILNNSGQLYDSLDLTTPILTIGGMTDFSVVAIFGRAYITPHNGITGLPGEKVYVYDGTTARPAAGVGPAASGMLAMDGPESGNVEPGFRIYAVAFESASGFLSQLGGFWGLTSVGGLVTTLLSIPSGPAGTVARVIFATKEIVDFNEDYANQTYYFVPGGRVPDNGTASISVSFFDADLKDNASYLLEQLSEIPAGVGIELIRGRMAVWGENLNPDTIRFSNIAEPEAFNEVDGFILVNPGDMGGGIKEACEYRGQCIMFKSQRSYSCLPLAEQPAFWEEPIEIDASVGTECHGLARGLDGGHTITDMLFLADTAGFRLYNGIFGDDGILTYHIDDIWARITDAYRHTVEVAVDPPKCLIYVAVPLDGATSPNCLLVGDYTEGLTQETIKWTRWDFPQAPTTIVVEVTDSDAVFKYGSISGNIYAFNAATRSDAGTAIDSWIEFAYLPQSDTDDIHNHYTGARFKVKGDGTLLITGTYPQGDVDVAFSGESIPLTLKGRTKFAGFNVTAEICSIKARVNAINKYFIMTKYILYIAPEWGDVD